MSPDAPHHRGDSTARRAEEDAIDAWIASSSASSFEPVELVAALGRRLAVDAGLPLDDRAPTLLQPALRCTPPEELEATVWTLGRVFERALDTDVRHRMGAHYTPRSVAEGLTEVAFECLDGDRGRADFVVCDPAVGGGAFLLAAAEALEARGAPPREVVEHRLWGIDIDPHACAVAELSLALWGSRDGHWVLPNERIVCADSLAMGAGVFGHEQRFDVVVGNPPFQGQLGAATARSATDGLELRARWGADAGPYADTAAFFLLVAHELCAADGVVALIEPESLLVSADAAAVRDVALERMTLVGMWSGGRATFDAAVRVCAPILRRFDRRPSSIQRWTGESFDNVAPSAPITAGASWAPLLADLLGVPALELASSGCVGDLAQATAGFREQFYGLAAHCVESATAAPDGAPLVTVGMIDPFRNRWGTGEFRFAKQRWSRPAVDLTGLGEHDPRLARWVRDRLQPKVLVATQTRVIEVAVDEAGETVPSTPVIAVSAPIDELWHVAAALASPVSSALAFHRAAGAALSADTLRLSSTQVLELPLPDDRAAWDDGVACARAATGATDEAGWAAALTEFGAAMAAAYGLDAESAATVLSWWQGRLPGWR